MRSALREAKAAAESGNQAAAGGEHYDLLFVTDATSSMATYLEALRRALPRVVSISALTGAFDRVGLLEYRDYSDRKQLLEWSGWQDPARDDAATLLQHAASIRPTGGGDYPEALKTALARAHELARPDATTLVILYTDAPPHLLANKVRSPFSNWAPEQTALGKQGAYGGCGPHFGDWVQAGHFLHQTDRRLQVIAMLPAHMGPEVVGFFAYLAARTSGAALQLAEQTAECISALTIEVLLAWMQVEKAGASEAAKQRKLGATWLGYRDPAGLATLEAEDSAGVAPYFLVPQARTRTTDQALRDNRKETDVTPEVLTAKLQKRTTPATDFAKRWKDDGRYRAMATTHLKRIITKDVQAMASNAVFGSLWRAVCSDRVNPDREELIQDFSRAIERIDRPAEKMQMKEWLEDSYDYAAEILEQIEAVPAAEKYPCVYLDPTLNFVKADGRDKSNKPLTEFTRPELLEIGRSCDRRILARLSRVLTRLTYVKCAADLPKHIADTNHEQVPRIPMALANGEHKNRFWKILMHTILPGTLLGARPAALLAALSLTLGIEPLAAAAEKEVLPWIDRWNDIETPENWNASCLSLLLDANDAYRARHPEVTTTLLNPSDQALFKKLIAYHIIELNLNTPLTALLGWTPQKSSAPIGPLVTCKACQYPRSVTVMNKNGQCGICVSTYSTDKERTACVTNRASADQTEATSAVWVECWIPTCRAQYVVYNVEDLNVRPKCHYCRLTDPNHREKSEPAPCVECAKCRNRMIWPEELRPGDFAEADFLCPACLGGQKALEEIETTPWRLAESMEDMSWLVADTDEANKFPLDRNHPQSVFKLVASSTPAGFAQRFSIFPAYLKPMSLRGKMLHNPDAILTRLHELVATRHVARDLCSMCFSDFSVASSDLTAACGRRGCRQRACRDCLSGWYGLNAPGRILNTAAVHCAFCRRLATARKLARWGNGVHAVADLRLALANQGHWIHAWCLECGHARQFVERVCAQGMPEAVENWRCDVCREAREAEERARLLALAAAAPDDAEEQDRIRQRLAKLDFAAAKDCPGCGLKTVKDGGCDHMQCPTCDAHWCYFCGALSSEQEIYRHMMQEHGGWFDGQDGGYDSGFEEDDYWE